MRRALNRCCRNVRWKDSVIGYELHAAQHTHELIDEIRTGTYRLSPYQKFTIFEPKRRDIVATRIRDRQVQMALCEGGLYQDFVEHFIYDNCACQKGKGTEFAIRRMKIHMANYHREHGADGWVLQGDVKHFFPSTRHDVAKAAVAKRISDPKARQYVFNVIDSFDGDMGIGLGSQISQLVELSVLDDMDHFIKEKLGIKHYIRYMDDFRLIHEDRDYLVYCKNEIEKHLAEIHLELNHKTCIHPLRQGVKFIQWRFMLTKTGGVIMKMINKKVNKEKQRLKKLLLKEKSGDLAYGTAEQSLQSWEANALRGNGATFYQRKSVRNYFERKKDEIYGDESGKTAESRT
ncbi:MAG: hypothetical protein IKR48_02660 [Kiritimatiellae bacterium]|nr:hypothetical protein [Kiritimatiellia bacterium]